MLMQATAYHLFKQSVGPGDSQLMWQHALALFGAMGTTAVEKDTIYGRTGYAWELELVACMEALSKHGHGGVDSCMYTCSASSGQRHMQVAAMFARAAFK